MSKLIPGKIYHVLFQRKPGLQDWFVGVLRKEERKTFTFDLLASPDWQSSSVAIGSRTNKITEITIEDLPLYIHAEVIHPLFERVLKTGKTKRNRKPKRVMAVSETMRAIKAGGLFQRINQKICEFF